MAHLGSVCFFEVSKSRQLAFIAPSSKQSRRLSLVIFARGEGAGSSLGESLCRSPKTT